MAPENTVPRLVVIEPPDRAGLVLAIDRPEMVIGHSDTADLVLDDRFVSRSHALVTTDESGVVTIRDLNSTGGTWVNNERITGPRSLRAGDLVRFADLVARYEAASESDWADVRPGLVLGTSGPEVGALHDALTVIGLQIEVTERETRSFGASTVAAVIKLQALAGIEQTGAVDENTLAIVSLALDRLGIRATEVGFTAREARYLVQGTVTDANGMPMARARVVAFDCELRSSKPIGETRTDEAGAYRIAYEADDLYEGKPPADLRVELTDDDGRTLFSSPITFNAPRQATINLALGGPAHAQPSEFSATTSAVTPLLGRLPATELEQDNEHQDLSFLAGQTGIRLERLGYWAVAARLAESTELPAELFYGLLRCGVPGDAHVTVLASSTQGVDLATNAQTLLSGVLSTSTITINAAIATAIATNVIPPSYSARAADDVAKIGTLATNAALHSVQGFGKTSFASVLDAVSVTADVQRRFIELYTAAVGSARLTFWRDLAANSGLSAQDVSTLRFGVLTGRLTRGYLPLINELAAQRSSGRITSASDLARLTTADWLTLLRAQQPGGAPIGVPSFIDANTPELAEQTYAAMLERFFTRAYPTTAFSARVAADASTPFAQAAPTAAFLDANPSFDLRYTNIDAFAATTAIPEAVRPTLLAAQRLIKVNSDYTVMSALMADGISSAQQIYFMGTERFAAAYGSLQALGATEAARIWARAEQTYGVALGLAMKFNAQLGAASPVAVGPVLPPDAQSQVAAFPTLQTLFGPDSFCACQECQSVLGDAAYLTDILQFLKQRAATPGSSVTAQSVLFERRSDLQYIQLNCQNTNTALPYVDLANELLEAYVAPGDPYADPNVRQTTLSTPELNANPQWLNQTAYDNSHLGGAVYPWTLPFDLPLAEARAYLGQLNLSRAQLIRTFQAPAGYPSAQADELAREQLGLSAVGADIITDGPLASGLSWDYWGLAQGATNSIVDPDDPTKTVTGTWIDVLTQVRVLLARAGLQYEDLAHLLNTIFVNGSGSVSITASPPDSCDVSTMTLNGLTQDVLDRIHRFVRLWPCLGWDPYDLDNAIASLQSTTAAGLAQLNDQLLRQLACVSEAMATYSLSVPSAVALFAPAPASVTIATRQIPTLPGDDPVNSLYQNLFENLTVLNPPDPIFALNAAGQIAALNPPPVSPPQLADHAAALVAAFQISQSDLTLAIATFTDGTLTLPNLSALYRNAELATGLGVTMTELISLLAFAETSIPAAPYYQVVTPFDGTRPESLATFAQAYAMITAAGLSIEQVDYIVRGVDNGTGVAPDPVTIGTVLLTLYTGLGKIAAANAFTPDPTGTKVRKALAALLDSANVNTAVAIMNGTSTLSTADQAAFVTTVLGAYMDPAAAQANLVGGAALPAGQARYEYVLANVLAYQVKTLSTGLIVQTLAQQFGVENQTMALLLESWFPSAVTSGQNLIADFLALPTLTLADTTDPVAPATAGFAPYFASYAALSKAALLIATLKLGIDDVNWWRGPSTGVGTGWLDPTTLPSTAQSGANGRFYRLSRLITATKVRDNVPIPNATFATLFTPAATATKSEYLSELASVTQWPAATLGVLCGDPASDAALGELSLTYPDDYVDEIALSRMLPCQAILAQTGIPADVSGWVAADVDSSSAAAIKQSVKANYPQAQWLTLAKQLRDPLRQAQRDALVSYLLAGAPPPGVSRWLDPDDVFAYFLIDVEMCACMATSRMVQATATVQLFVLRCFLGLEPSVDVDVSTDQFWGQWQWMSQYRVWEANREVFLWPENWIDPTLRHDASPFFSDLMQDLSQGDLTRDVAATALQNYLEKLEAVARLDVCGYFHDLENATDVLRVLARTQGSPPTYYTRTWVDSSKWTAWEEVKLDIVSDHVLPIFWNGRQYIFWAIVTAKADQNNQQLPAAQTSATPPNPPSIHLEVQLAWSQYKHGKWQAKQVAPQTLVFSGAWPPYALLVTDMIQGITKASFESPDITLKSSTVGPLLQVDVFLEPVSQYDGIFYQILNQPRSHVGQFLLGGAGTGAELFVVSQYQSQLQSAGGGTPISQVGTLDPMLKLPIGTPTNSIFDGSWLAGSAMTYQTADRPRTGPMTTSYAFYGTLRSETVLNQADYYRLITPHQTPTFDSTLPFFYRDSRREYFIVPTNYYQNGNYFTINAPEYVYDPFYQAEYTFWTFYHPWAWLLVSQLNSAEGIDALYDQQVQLNPAGVAGVTPFDFGSYYQPTGYVLAPYPDEGMDFGSPPSSSSPSNYSIYNAPYAIYNWELFFHAPFLIANSLSTNQQFQLAKQWYEYVFDPAGRFTGSIPQCYWLTKPFSEMTAADYSAEQITALMNAINKGDPTLEHQVAAWRQDPFDPDAIAQMRPVAYQRAIVMRYIDNLIAWGDQLFTQDTMETINLATQMYVLASNLLGPRPEIVPPLVEPESQNYSQLVAAGLDAFSNAAVAAENAIPPVKVNVPTSGNAPSLPSLLTLYFQIPPNTTLLAYWDTVADRLFKIRHCMNIEGIVQQLPLFSPPINPGLLVAAAAAGLDLSSVLADMTAAVPPYRFRTMVGQALELCEQVRGLGAQLLSALEKGDAEQMARIRSTGEINLQSAIDDIRARQIDDANQQLTVLAKAKQTFQDRASFYVGRPLMNDWETAALILRATAPIAQAVAAALDTAATVSHAIPTVEAGAAGFGGSPSVNVKIGGPNVGHASQSGAWVARMTAAIIQTGADLTSTLGGFHQRQDAWTMEGNVAQDEMARIDAETAAANIRVDIATKEKAAQDIAVTNAQNVDAFLHSKFTDKELYDWMTGQISTTYFQAYQLAYSIAKAAEQCFDRELGLSDTSYIQFGYWDSLRQGLMAGEKLQYDLRRMQSAYFTQNERELEIVKHVSLLQLDPYALVELRETGTCLIDLPEILFDLDNPGHYMRRLKAVGLTVPCVVGPYTSVSATLTLLANQVRTSPDVGSGYPRTNPDSRFTDDPGGVSEIVTSGGQNDSGLFELRLDDERYLPFETAGAVSNWRLTLNNVFPQFDYTTITDVVMHLRYTARDGGSELAAAAATAAKSKLNSVALAESRTGLYRLFSARHEYPTNWAQFIDPAPGADQILTLPIPPERFQFITHGLDVKVRSIDVLTNATSTAAYTLQLTTPTSVTQTVTMNPDPALGGMHHIQVVLSPVVDLGRTPTPSAATPPTWTIKLKEASAANYQSLAVGELDDILLIVAYEVSP
jgi:Tc toxin complex TcA C-terminal TcB-binding domain/Neuraminidase-like domain/FHA domain/Putative peptidoglycan binding domain